MNEREIFTAAVQQSDVSARDAYLAKACGDNAGLRERVCALLVEHERLGNFMESPSSLDIFDRAISETPGTQIGPYKLLEQIGDGGFGVVFMAEQLAPVRRMVALKVIKPGMDTKQVIARFEVERQALAVMDHANIARVFDGGTSESNRPYFVMELVRGVPITDYCDQNDLSVRERLELFTSLSQAIQHAHTKGIIHRDIKPTNVLVTRQDGRAVVKVIDFGVAKALGQQLTEKTLFTKFTQMIGTPLYMSPEQAEMSSVDIDTRSDIYSLGVLLYEVLTGSTPMTKEQLKEAPFDEVRRMIREDEPPKPSTRISTAAEASTIAARRQTEPAKLTRLLRGELDWVVMKCLEKDRSRRYETASALTLDIQRYLADEPVQACPPSVGYRLRKFVQRNKRVLAMAALLGTVVLTAVIAIAAILGWMARDRSVRNAKLISEFELALHQVGEARDLILTQTGNVAQWDAGLAAAMAAVQRAEGMARQSEVTLDGQLQERLVQLKATLAADDVDRRFAHRIDDIRLEQSEIDMARHRFNTHLAFPEIRRAFKSYYGIDVGATLPLDVAKVIQERPLPIQEHMLAALYLCSAWTPADEPQARDWCSSVLILADSDPWRKQTRDAVSAGNWVELENLIDQDLARQPVSFLLSQAYQLPSAVESTKLNVMRRIQQAYPGDFWANLELAASLCQCKPPHWDEAIGYMMAALALRPKNPVMFLHLSHAAKGMGDVKGSIAYLRTATTIAPKYGAAQYNLGVALQDIGDVQGAIVAYRQAVALDLNYARTNLGVNLMAANDLDGAMEVFRDAIAIDPKDFGAHINLGRAFMARGQLDEAIAELHIALDIAPNLFECHANLGNALLRKKLWNEAINSYQKAADLRPDNPDIHRALGLAFQQADMLDESIAAYREALRLKSDFPVARSALAIALNNKAWGLAVGKVDVEDAVRAVELAKEAVDLAPTVGTYLSTLGMAHYRAGQWREAIAVLDSAIEADICKAFCGFFLAMAHYRLGETTEARKRYDQAVEWMDMDMSGDCDLLPRFRAESEELLEIKPQKL